MVIFVIVWPISLASVLQCYNTSFKISELTYQSQHMFSEMRPYFWQMQFAQSPAHILSIICAMSNIVYISTNYIRCLFAAGQNETENIKLCHQLQYCVERPYEESGDKLHQPKIYFFSQKLSMHKAIAHARHVLTSCLCTLRFCDVQHRLYFDKLHLIPFCCWLKWNWGYEALPSIAILRRAVIWRIGRQTASTENIFFSRKLSMHKAKAQARHILTSCLRTLHFSPAQNTGPRFLEDIAKNRYKTSKN